MQICVEPGKTPWFAIGKHRLSHVSKSDDEFAQPVPGKSLGRWGFDLARINCGEGIDLPLDRVDPIRHAGRIDVSGLDRIEKSAPPRLCIAQLRASPVLPRVGERRDFIRLQERVNRVFDIALVEVAGEPSVEWITNRTFGNDDVLRVTRRRQGPGSETSAAAAQVDVLLPALRYDV